MRHRGAALNSAIIGIATILDDALVRLLFPDPASHQVVAASHARALESLLLSLFYGAGCGSAMSPSYFSSRHRRYRCYVCLRPAC
jgi:hypothetical protein